MSEEVAEVTFNGEPTGVTFSGEDAEEQAWRYVMRKAVATGTDDPRYDVFVGEVNYGE